MLRHLFSYPWFLPIFFLCLVTGTFFYKTILFEKIPLPADLLLNAYFPWHDYAWPPYGEGLVPVKNAEHSDAISQFFPFAKFTYEQVRAGSIPLWNPYIGSGMPFLAAYHTSVLSPLNLFAFVTSLLWYWSLQVIIPILLLGVFSYVLFSSLVRARWAALVGSIAVMFSSFTMFWIEYGPGLKTIMWLPLGLLAIKKVGSRSTSIWFIVLTFSVAFLAMGGDVQTFLYSLFLLAAFTFCFYFPQKKVLLVLCFMAIGLGLFVAAPQLLLTQEYQKFSGRGESGYNYLSTVDFGLTPFYKIVTLLAPDFFGNSATKNLWGSPFYFSGLIYIGILPLFLALFSLLRREKFIYFLWAVLFVASVFFYDSPISRWVYETKVPFFSTVSANRMFGLVIFILGLLAIYGAETFLQAKKYAKRLLFVIPAMFLLLVIITIFLRSQAAEAQLLNLTVGIKNLILPAAVIGLTFILLLAAHQRIFTRAAQATLLLILCLELLRFGWKVAPFVPTNFVFPKTAATEFLSQDGSFYRVGGNIPSNFLMPYRIPSAEGYDSLTVYSYAKYVATANNGPIPGAYLEFDNPNSELMALANVKYFAETKFTDRGEPSSEGQPPVAYRNDNFKKVLDDKSIAILENMSVQPRVRFFDQYEVLPEKQIWQRLKDKTADPLSLLFLDKHPGLGMAQAATKGSAAILYYSPRQIMISSSSSAPSLLFLADTYYPGWQAKVDGKRTEILKAQGTFRAIALNPGNHVVEFSYTPATWQIGLYISSAAIVFTVIIALGLRNKRIKQYVFGVEEKVKPQMKRRRRKVPARII